MSSTISALLLPRKLLFSTNKEDVQQWSTIGDLFSHVLIYVAILAMLALMLFFILKILGGFEDTILEEFNPMETNPLRPRKSEFVDYNYGTISRENVEKGSCSSSSSSSNSSDDNENKFSNSGSEELYDGKLCVICYDEQRDCFFVPCGHCATCYVCAQRIFYGESKTCPVCRRLIGKVRRLFA